MKEYEEKFENKKEIKKQDNSMKFMTQELKFMTQEIDLSDILYKIEEEGINENGKSKDYKEDQNGKRRLKRARTRSEKIKKEEVKTDDYTNSFGKQFLKNIMLLVGAQILVKILGLIYKVIIVNIPGFGDIGNGYYSSGYEIYALLLTLSSIGIPSVIAKLVSERAAVGDNKGAHRIFKVALSFFAGVGLLSSIMLYVFSDTIATDILKTPDVSLVLKVLAPAIVLVAVSAVIRGYFSGLDDMKVTSVSQTLEQFLNALLSVVLVYMVIGKESYIMAAAGNVATTLSVVLAFIYVYMYYKKKKIVYDKKQKSKEDGKSYKEILKIILALSIPITLASLVSVINTVIDTITITNNVQVAFEGIIHNKEELTNKAVELKGLLSKVNTVIGLPQSITVGVAIAIVPVIAALIAKGEIENAKEKLSRSINIATLIILPATAGLTILAEPVLKLMYPNASNGALLMMMLSVPTIFICLTMVVNSGLQALGEVKIPLISVIIVAVVKLVLNNVLIPITEINIYGAAISSIIGQIVAFLISYKALINRMDFKIDRVRMFRIIMSTIIMSVLVYITYIILSIAMKTILIPTTLAILVGIITYTIAIFKLKAVDDEDVISLPGGRKILSFVNKFRK